MRIPTEHFSRVPVFALSPGLSSPEGSDDGSSSPTFGRALMNRLMAANAPSPAAPAPQQTQQQQRFNSVGSAPTSPSSARRTSSSATPTQHPADAPPPAPKLELLDSVGTPDSTKVPPEEQPHSLPVIMDKPTPAQRGSVFQIVSLFNFNFITFV